MAPPLQVIDERTQRPRRLSSLSAMAKRRLRIVRDSLPAATGVTIVGENALALVSRVKAVVVPYRRSRVARQSAVQQRRPFEGVALC
ncbi:MAG TPA: hypothetical protein VGN73_00945 [Gemmatimonadaceae bacterium]|nr:hypothetical protein [Gemmatimonadaceae bacterium]